MQSKGPILKVELQDRIKSYTAQRWEDLNDRQKGILKKGWGIITYKWRWQIAMNIPYLAIFVLDKTVPAVHQFDMALIASVTSRLPIPNFILSIIGIG